MAKDLGFSLELSTYAIKKHLSASDLAQPCP